MCNNVPDWFSERKELQEKIIDKTEKILHDFGVDPVEIENRDDIYDLANEVVSSNEAAEGSCSPVMLLSSESEELINRSYDPDEVFKEIDKACKEDFAELEKCVPDNEI